ncbi:MAG: hypothetical protein RQ885_12040 [Desulfurococcales archaeon]|nr:hypothetical protein [Desulfurococcales archaeon]
MISTPEEEMGRRGAEESLELYMPRGYTGIITDALKSIVGDITVDAAGLVSLRAGGLRDASKRVLASLKSLKADRVLVVADEERAAGNIEGFRNWLERMANFVAYINEDYTELGSEASLIVLTSDALAAKIYEVVGNKVSWALMWSLPRNASEDLISQIGLQCKVARELGISSEEANEILWRLAGGNPRALGLIWEKGIKKWLEVEVIDGIRRFARDLPKGQRGKALEEISASLDKVDDMGWLDPSVRNIMLKHNIIIYIVGADKISEIAGEPWIGREYAYQLPAYYYALKIMARKRSMDISPEEVIKEAKG